MTTFRSTIRIPRSWKRLATVRFEDRDGNLFVAGTEDAVLGNEFSWDASSGSFLNDWRRVAAIFPNGSGLLIDLTSDRSGYTVSARIHDPALQTILKTQLDGLDDEMTFEIEGGNTFIVEVEWFEIDIYADGYDVG